MEVPKPQQPVAPIAPSTPQATSQPGQPQAHQQGTMRAASPAAFVRKPSSRTSVFIVVGFVLSLLGLGIGYIVFIKPDTGPATTLFAKLFPARSGLVQLQTIELDFDTILNSPVFTKLQHKGAPIEIPPMGKPNPFL